MSYYYECDNCGHTEQIQLHHPPQLEVACDGCGVFGCEQCVNSATNICDACDDPPDWADEEDYNDR